MIQIKGRLNFNIFCSNLFSHRLSETCIQSMGLSSTHGSTLYPCQPTITYPYLMGNQPIWVGVWVGMLVPMGLPMPLPIHGNPRSCEVEVFFLQIKLQHLQCF